MRRTLYALSLVVIALAPLEHVASSPTATPAPPPGALGTYVRGPTQLTAGTPAALRIATHASTSERASAPLPNVAVEVALESKQRRQVVWRGKTDAAGVADARFSVPSWPEGAYTVRVSARHPDGRHDLHTHEVSLVAGAKLLLESDKPLYQPGQMVHLRALAVRPQDGRPVAAHTATFIVTDPRGNEVFHQDQPLSDFGVTAADMPLADELTLGAYHARVELEGAHAGELALTIARYQLPKFKVSLEPDRPYYAPGERATVHVEARYFFGKPVARGSVSLDAALAGNGLSIKLRTLKATLDSDGKATVQLELPRTLESEEATLRLSADVSDEAEHHEQAAREAPVSTMAARLELTPEVSVLVPGVENRLWVTAARPDGTPMAGAELEIKVNGAELARTRTDAIGVAQVAYTPRSNVSVQSCQGALVEAGLREHGVVAWQSRCVRVGAVGTLLVRPDRALYPMGAPLTVEVAGLGPDGIALLDVVKDGQTVDTAELHLKAGVGRVTLPPDARRFGTLSLEAYRIGPDGSKQRGARLVYVARPSALTVEVHPQYARQAQSFRPGEKGRIKLRVVDAVDQRGVKAQVGVVMVDQSVLALKAMQPGAARLYFTLAREATQPSLAMKVRPGGYTVERLVDAGLIDALKDEAGRILLAGAVAPEQAWETDPWQERLTARDEQLTRLGEKLGAYARTHAVGEHAGKGWRFRRDLLPHMVDDGALAARDLHDPWGRRQALEVALAQAGLSDFDSFAQQNVNDRLTLIYQAFARAGLERTLPDDTASGKKKGALLALADLDKLAQGGKLDKNLLVDPWGRPWRVAEKKRAYLIGNLRSRFLIASAGPDGVAGNGDDLYPVDESYRYSRHPVLKVAEVQVMGAVAADAFGRGGLGVRGYGYGGGGTGAGIGLGSIGVAGRGGTGGASGGEEPRLRQKFPETMLWRPDLLTDGHGEATLDVEMADSITTWQLSAEAISADGRIGQTTAEVRVFQDFFADLDLPPVVTQHDELSVPVAVYNYLPSSQRVTLTLEDKPWFTRLSDKTQTIDLQPSQVGVRYFRIRAEHVGRKTLMVKAEGAQAADALEKPIEIAPDGEERALSFQDRLEAGARQHTLTIPPDAIADASLAGLKIYPAMSSHVIEGLDSMLRMPGGCFEQTSSTTYPNALILDYLRKSGKSTPQIEQKAKQYLQTGWQRLVSFEVPGGGFSWFGQAPANKILTAYGIEEFSDMSKVFPVDKRVIARTEEWLARQQRGDGSWAPDTQFINEGATNRFNSDVLRITAYIAVALKHTGYKGPALDKAMSFVQSRLQSERPKDAYTLALVGELLAGGSEAGALEAVLERLWQERTDQPDGKTVAFSSKEKTPTYGDGKSGTVETTALAAFSMLQTKEAQLGRIDRAVGYLLGAKDTFGNWYSTQATILSLKALLAYGTRSQARASGTLAVAVDGREVGRYRVRAGEEALGAIDLAAATVPGKHTVSVRFDGAGQISYQLVSRWFEPRAATSERTRAKEELEVATRIDRERLKAGDAIVEKVRVVSHAGGIDMPIVEAGLPPGFDVDQEALDGLVKARIVEKVQATPRALVFYLAHLEGGKAIELPVHLKARFPARVQVPAPTVYEYYKPERRAVGAAGVVTVEG